MSVILPNTIYDYLFCTFLDNIFVWQLLKVAGLEMGVYGVMNQNRSRYTRVENPFVTVSDTLDY